MSGTGNTVLAVFVTVMVALAFLLMLFVCLCTGFFMAKAPSGADAMGLVVPMLAWFASWGMIGLATWLCAGGGGLQWVAGGRFTAAVIATVVLIGVALASGTGGLAWAERHAAGGIKGFLGCFVLPVGVMVVLLASTWSDRSALATAWWSRAAWVALPPVAVLGAWLTFTAMFRHSEVVAQHKADEQVKEQQRQEELQRIAALPPVEQVKERIKYWTPQTRLSMYGLQLKDETDSEAQQYLVERMSALPNVEEQLREAITSDRPEVRGGAMAYMSLAPASDPSWEGMLAEAMMLLARQIESEGRMYSGRYKVDFGASVRQSLALAKQLGGDYAEPAAALRKAVESTADGDSRTQILADPNWPAADLKTGS